MDSPATLQTALNEDGWDIVITDHNLPEFGSEAAIRQVKQADLDLPIIIVSGCIGEEVAVAAMKSGAHDYIMKGNLSRLVPAIERELREAQNRHEHRGAQETIQYLAYHDALTGLCNRAEFEQRLARALKSAGADSQHALFYLDMDQFKIVNDTCGHVAGDELLKQVALLLKGPVRDSDTLARLGGDEFGVLLDHCSLSHAEEVAERMLQLVKEFRFAWLDKTFTIGASIGLVMLDNPNQTHTELLRAADMACYAAKDKGRGRVHVYRPDDVELTQRRGEMEWVSQLTRALQDKQFVLHKQCIIALEGATPGPSCEFLLRLRGRDGNLILPGAFIPAAERYNLMPKLDRWVLKQAFAHLAQQFATRQARADSIYFINLSGATLGDETYLQFVKEALSRNGIPPQAICFEVTETTAIANLTSALAFIQNVKSLGCKVALDDFGSGLSSFSYLKTLAADYLKIDGAFVRDMLEDPMDAAIVQAINSIGHVAGLKTIAEFVEHEDIQTKLAEIGVDYAQGYAIHRPQPVNEACMI
ncbi:MAG: histidine kinase [Betaproteobacteria bacterium RBG_19FT_COMBO_58_11]|nr:MAG: histidine kinase [Betaproteobacteria bacterium RBG_19FT_COMBO_58_11]